MTTTQKRICMTGPASERAAKRWMEAALAAGWSPIHLPFVRIEAARIHAPAVTRAPAFVAITSQNALPSLRRLWGERPDVRTAPHAAVGVATARALRVLGVDPVFVSSEKDANSTTLAAALVDRTERGQRVLWPRGDRATDLKEMLQSAGRAVDAPVAYRSVDVEDTVVPRRLHAAFFASPSAVRVWIRTNETPRVTAIAIGQTTQAELAPEYARFSRIECLQAPTPKALRETLAALGAPPG